MSIPTIHIPISSNSCRPFIKQGDTIPAIEWNMGSSFSEDLTENHIIRMQLYVKGNRVVNISSLPSGGITITGAKTFEIDEVVENDYPAGKMNGDLQIERYTDFGFDPVEVRTYANIEYRVEEEYTKRP